MITFPPNNLNQTFIQNLIKLLPTVSFAQQLSNK